MNKNYISDKVKVGATQILEEIKKANSILLHCHPNPDPDSVGSALAMKFALEQMGKRATVIGGDSAFPHAFSHFPGAGEIVKKNFFEVDLKDFDLFIILDSAQRDMISKRGEVVFLPSLRTIVIDHHISNKGYGDINLIVPEYASACEVLFDLFHEWKVEMNTDIAHNLFIGIYSDTGGLQYDGVTANTYRKMSELVEFIPNISALISKMLNDESPKAISFIGIALDSIESYYDNNVAVSFITNEIIKGKGIDNESIETSQVVSMMKEVREWNIVACIVEQEPSQWKMSFRSKDIDKYDVSKIAVALGGGGHKGAAGALVKGDMETVKKMVVEKIKEIYNF